MTNGGQICLKKIDFLIETFQRSKTSMFAIGVHNQCKLLNITSLYCCINTNS